MARKTISLAIVLASFTIAACTGDQSRKNVCPIDGRPPQWVGQRNGKSCEFFHYSDMERHSHSWWADCEQSGTQQPNSLPNNPP